ncbi:MAG: hypothetical protein SGBAC_001627 [Bacillariaceae sp.]
MGAIGRNSFTGTQIDATRPVTVTNGLRCANVPVGINVCEHIFEVAQPVQNQGVATKDNTTIILFGDSSARQEEIVLDRNGYFERTLSGALYAENDKPALMVQFMTPVEYLGAVSEDPAMGNVISIDQYLSDHTFSTVRNKYDVKYVSIMPGAYSSDLDTLVLDGTSVAASRFSPN